jgi:hypothetical protein
MPIINAAIDDPTARRQDGISAPLRHWRPILLTAAPLYGSHAAGAAVLLGDQLCRSATFYFSLPTP